MSFIRRSSAVAVLFFFLSLSFSSLSFSNEPVDINRADVETLTQLKNIGVKKAQAIVAYRDEQGGFKSIDDLVKVKGIGEETLEVNRSNLIAVQ